MSTQRTNTQNMIWIATFAGGVQKERRAKHESHEFTVATELTASVVAHSPVNLSRRGTCRHIDPRVRAVVRRSNRPPLELWHSALQRVVALDARLHYVRVKHFAPARETLRGLVVTSRKCLHNLLDALELNMLGNRFGGFVLRQLDGLQPPFDLLTPARLQTRQTLEPVDIDCRLRRESLLTSSMTT